MRAYNYDDIYLLPNKCRVSSRATASTDVILGRHTFSLPIVTANMTSTISPSWSKYLDNNGYFYVMHRFNNATVPFVKYASVNDFKIISISTGVEDDTLRELEQLLSYKIDYITIDVAHGHAESVAKRIKFIKDNFKNTYVIAGNVATNDGSLFLQDSGADAVKVGIGSGVICTTKLQTGFHIPMFTCVEECSRGLSCDIIADGGIKYPGDVTKALVAGATMVMAGGMFACCSDSPAAVVDGKKVYYGSTSLTAKNTNNHIEGRTINIDVEVNLENKLVELKQALQSSISYAGGDSLKAFLDVRFNTKF